MILELIKKTIFILFITVLIFFFKNDSSYAENKILIKKKINDEIITNIDIKVYLIK